MNVPVFHAYPYAHLHESEFEIRFGGLQFMFLCERFDGERRRIRKARALLVRETVVTAQSGQSWKLNRNGTKWTFCAPGRVGSIPSHEVHWALSDRRNLVETWQHGRVIRWKVTKKLGQCYHCDTQCEVKYAFGGPGVEPAEVMRGKWAFWTCLCDKCRKRVQKAGNKAFSLESHARGWWNRMRAWWNLLRRAKVDKIPSQDRSSNLQWVRKFVTSGSFTASEFRALCAQYRNVCLRCKRKRPLVADHVIPLARGGRNDIANIQPLCKRCNGVKGTDSTDYRKKWRKQ